MVTLDTSALLTLIDRRAPMHETLVRFVMSERGPLVVPMGVMAEITYFIETRFSQRHLEEFLRDIAEGSYTLHCGDADIPRVRELVERYQDLPLGYADASVIACAERFGGRVATIDFRHFGAVAREGTIQIVP